jgi:heme-degrading monooxygenase HmoA
LDKTEKARTSAGGVLDHIYRDTEDPNKLVVIQKWTSLSNARKYYNSDVFKEAIARGGVEGKSTIEFVEEA